MIMGKGRGKGKKFVNTNDEDIASGEEEKIPAQKKRGRPLKLRREEINDDEYEQVEAKEVENAIISVSSKEMTSSTITEAGRKRKAKGKSDSFKGENGIETRSNSEEFTKFNGFRLNGSRRKSKPCRAAEAGVACLQYFG